MISTKVLKRFFGDIKLSVSPIPDEKYLSRVFEVFPNAKIKYNQFISEFGDNFGSYLDTCDIVRANILRDIKNNQIYKEFVSSDMSSWSPREYLPGFFSRKPLFDLPYTHGEEDNCYLSIDLKSANFQALREVGVYDDLDWNSLISKYVTSKHIQDSKYFRSVVYGNLNVGRIQTVETFLVNEIRLLLRDKFDSVAAFLTDEIIYNINDTREDCNRKDISDLVKEKLGLDVNVKNYKLRRYYLQSKGNPDRKIQFFGKLDLENNTEGLVGLGAPYYLLGNVLWNNMDVCEEDLLFLNQEGYVCKILDTFEIKRGI